MEKTKIKKKSEEELKQKKHFWNTGNRTQTHSSHLYVCKQRHRHFLILPVTWLIMPQLQKRLTPLIYNLNKWHQNNEWVEVGRAKIRQHSQFPGKIPAFKSFPAKKWQQRFEKWRWVDSKYVRPLMGSVHGFVLHVAYSCATVTFDWAMESSS